MSRSLRNRRFREKGAKTCCFWDGSCQAGGRRRALGLQHFYNQTQHKFAIYEGRWYIKIEVVALAEDVVLSMMLSGVRSLAGTVSDFASLAVDIVMTSTFWYQRRLANISLTSVSLGHG
jgi:hypothetical protein